MNNFHPESLLVASIASATSIRAATGTYASQFVVKGLSAVNGAANKLKDEIRRLSLLLAENKPDKIEFGMGQQGPKCGLGSRAKSINYFGLANIVNVNTAILPPGLMTSR